MKQKELESQQVQTGSWIFTNSLLTLQYMITVPPVSALTRSIRHIPQTAERHNYDYLTLSLQPVLGFRPFLRKFYPSSVRFRNLKISWKSVRKCEISRKSVPENGSKIENRKSKVADRIFENSSGPSFRTDFYRNYSLGAPVPVLHGFPAKFLQKIEWKKVACRCMAILRNRNFISYFA